ncbi:hypothetical protein HC928_10290, partial [bacterium]|nr:hypothetical protein [bacterium]
MEKPEMTDMQEMEDPGTFSEGFLATTLECSERTIRNYGKKLKCLWHWKPAEDIQPKPRVYSRWAYDEMLKLKALKKDYDETVYEPVSEDLGQIVYCEPSQKLEQARLRACESRANQSLSIESFIETRKTIEVEAVALEELDDLDWQHYRQEHAVKWLRRAQQLQLDKQKILAGE